MPSRIRRVFGAPEIRPVRAPRASIVAAISRTRRTGSAAHSFAISWVTKASTSPFQAHIAL